MQATLLSDWAPLSLDHLLFCEDCKSTAWQCMAERLWLLAPWSLCRWRWLAQGAWWVVTIHGPSEDNLNVQTWHRSYYVAPAAHSEEQLQPQQYCNIVTGGQFYNCALCRVTQAGRRCWRQSKKRISKACTHCTQTNISFVGFQRFCFNGASITLLHCFC